MAPVPANTSRNQHLPAQPRPAQPLRRDTIPLYLGFAATGIGVALPGAALPALLARWHLNDAQGGRLFLLAWIGSSLGALAVRGSLRTTLFAGCVLAALGSAALSAADASQSYLAIAIYGMGLGLSMTSISLLRQGTAAHSGTDLVRLNLLWAAGACACPALAAHTLRAGDVHPLLDALALLFASLGLWTLARPGLGLQPIRTGTLHAWMTLRRVPPALLLIVVLITGIEASAGGWLATYAHRGGDRLAEVVAAPTCLWAALLVSRFFWSTWSRCATASAAVRGSATLMLAGALLLTSGRSGWPVLLAAFALGFGIGPIYPLALDCVLRLDRAGPIFFLAGVGSAALPWLTGLLSTAGGSLRLGLTVVLAAAFLVAVLSWLSPLDRWTSPCSSLRERQPAAPYTG